MERFYALSKSAAKPSTVEVQTPRLDVKTAWSSDAMERKQASLETSTHGFRFSVKPFQIVTVRLEAEGNVR